MVLLILAAVWGVFLVPQIVRARSDRGPADSIGSFRNQLSMIERSLPGGPASRVSPLARRQPAAATFGTVGAPMSSHRMAYAPPTRSELQRRRQNVLLALLAAVVFSLALGLLFKPAFALNIVADLGLAGYVTMLVRARAIASEREMKVRYLPGPTLVPSAEPAYLLRRSGS